MTEFKPPNTCPKCGYDGHRSTAVWGPIWVGPVYVPIQPFATYVAQDALRWTCNRCGYETFTKTLDQVRPETNE